MPCDGTHFPNTNSLLSVFSSSVASVCTCAHRQGTRSSQTLSLSSFHSLTTGSNWEFSHYEPWILFLLSVPKTKCYCNTTRYWTFHCDDIFHCTKAMKSKTPDIITKMRTLPLYFLEIKSMCCSLAHAQCLKKCTYKCPSYNYQSVVLELQCC